MRRRIPCELWVEGRRYSAMILDFSGQGFFVQTSARPRPGCPVELVARMGRASQELRIETQVARRYVVPPALRRIAHGGIGLEVLSEDAEVKALLSAGFGAPGPHHQGS